MQNGTARRPKTNPQPDKRIAVAYALNEIMRRSYDSKHR